ncbi:MAG TPA: TRAP transporter small permease [Rhizobiaceae bacterium]
MDLIDKIIDKTASLFARIAGMLIVVIAVMVAVDVVARNTSGAVLVQSYELSSYLFAISLSLGMAYVGLSGAHIRLDVVYVRFPHRIRRLLDVLALASLTGVSAFLFYLGFELAVKNFTKGVVSTSHLAIPLATPQFVWVFGLGVFALTSLLLSIRHAAYLLSGRGDAADRIGSINPEKEIEEAIEDANAEGARA